MNMDIYNVLDDDELDAHNIIVFGIPRAVNIRSEHFHSYDNITFRERFRVTKNTALLILELIENELEFPYNWNNAVSPMNQLLLFLRFCATGSHLTCIGEISGVHISTASRIIVRVATAIARHYNQFITMPQNEEERRSKMLNFYRIARFPRVIGAIDCTHVRIQSPGGVDAEIFRNRKGYFSLNIQAIVDADLKLMNLVSRWPGSAHDATIFNNSRIKHDFDMNRFSNSLLLGDSGYFMKKYLLTPLQNPVTEAEQRYNESHIRTRNTVERFFGVWKRRFPVLAYGCRLKLQTLLKIIVATGILHNICKLNGEDIPEPEDILRFQQMLDRNNVPNIAALDNDFNVRRLFIENHFGDLIPEL